MNEILISVVSMAGLGIFFAVVLAVADRNMSIKEDRRLAQIEGILPGANCGACGYSGCHAFAMALSTGDASATGCPAGGEDTAAKIAALMGMEKGIATRSVAVVHCNADSDQRKRYAQYKGIETCKAADKILSGGIACVYGCLGYGDCKKACPFGAITMANGLPIVDSTKCTSCGKCIEACPRNLFTIEKFINNEIVTVACRSKESGAVVKRVCGVGCIGCKICEKLTRGVFEVRDNLAEVHYDRAGKDTDWNKAIEKCPAKVIVKVT